MNMQRWQMTKDTTNIRHHKWTLYLVIVTAVHEKWFDACQIEKPPSSPPPSSLQHRSPVTPSTFYTLAPPTARFCPNRAFCVAGAPDFKPTSSLGRGDADVGTESESRVKELGGVREESFSLVNTEMRHIKSPTATPPSPLSFLRRCWRVGSPPTPAYISNRQS